MKSKKCFILIIVLFALIITQGSLLAKGSDKNAKNTGKKKIISLSYNLSSLGNSASLLLELTNKGKEDISNVAISLDSTDYLNIVENRIQVGNLSAGENTVVETSVFIADDPLDKALREGPSSKENIVWKVEYIDILGEKNIILLSGHLDK